MHFARLIIAMGVAVSVFSADAGAGTPATALPDRIVFNRDVRPILSDNCSFCHGFDKNKRKADLRLDTPEGLFGKSKAGVFPAVPGKPGESEIIRRITTKDPDEVMPPANHPKRLLPRDIAVLTRWIEQGAAYQGHWAYIAPVRSPVPHVAGEGVRSPIDAFISDRLHSEGLAASAQADRVTLLRRVTFDLTGLPPTAAEAQQFIADRAPEAYEKVVDRLLASPRFGERMAMYWLDQVRYADTIGYHSDNPMNVSPYREWVIGAFNANKPFDQFTVEQLAGDLLPNATIEQKVASGYNRLLQTTEEGGAQAKEYIVKNFTDRVRNYSTVWLGATMGCAQCHDHKFDPLAMREFYSMAAFFADVQEAPIGRREPGMPVPTAAQAVELGKLDAAIAALQQKLLLPTPQIDAEQADWEKNVAGGLKVEWSTTEVVEAKAKQGTKIRQLPEGVLLASPASAGGEFPDNDIYTVTLRPAGSGLTALRLEVFVDEAFPAKGPGVSPNGNFVLTDVKLAFGGGDKKDRKAKEPIKFVRASADFSQEGFPVSGLVGAKKSAGWAVLPEVGKSHEAVLEFEKPIVSAAGDTLVLTLDFGSIFPKHQFGRFRLSTTASAAPAGENSIPAPVRRSLAISSEMRSKNQLEEIAKYFRTIAPVLQSVRKEIAADEKAKADLIKTVPTCLISATGTPRIVKILARGNWQDDTGVAAEPEVPEALGRLGIKDRRATRLDLARWTISRQNPLTSRVFVNRAWKMFFGQGLSKVLDDLGYQGEWPTHPELLDWLAVEFMESGWDVKHLIRLMVTSETYRQSSMPAATMKEKDPYNRLYARQSRFRLDAEMVRDNALAVSGLLAEKVGGPSVFPYQPKGYWFALNFPAREWQNDTGAGLYRRGIYTHWQRSFPHPSLIAFDAPSREEATCERARSNIPQQALTLLNDPTYVEAARALADRVLVEPGDDGRRLSLAFSRVVARPPTEQEAQVLRTLLQKNRGEYAKSPESAKKLLAIGDAKPVSADAAELAAWTSVARVLLNLSEAITRE